MDDDNEKQAWYEDGDKASAIAATIILGGLSLAGAILIVGFAAKIVTWMF
jgi:hypothetical protein